MDKASFALQKLYDHLAAAINAAADLQIVFANDKRSVKAKKAVSLIMKTQELMNPLAEDEDINLV